MRGGKGIGESGEWEGMEGGVAYSFQGDGRPCFQIWIFENGLDTFKNLYGWL
jgi:hypothetical protein